MRILRPFGLQGVSGHETHSKKEIRALLSQAHAHGELTRTEHRLLDAVFDFSDTICRHIMLPRVKIEFVDVGQPREALLATIQRSMYTRYPVCDGSLDTVLGDMHIKDLFRVDFEAPELSLRTTLPPPPPSTCPKPCPSASYSAGFVPRQAMHSRDSPHPTFESRPFPCVDGCGSNRSPLRS